MPDATDNSRRHIRPGMGVYLRRPETDTPTALEKSS